MVKFLNFFGIDWFRLKCSLNLRISANCERKRRNSGWECIKSIYNEGKLLSLSKICPSSLSRLRRKKSSKRTNKWRRHAPAHFRRPSTGTNNQSLQWGFATRLAFDHELPADRPAFLSAPRTSVASLPFDSFPPPFPDNGNDDEIFLDVLMTEPAPKLTLLSSRSTDAKSSDTPVVDDV